MSSVVAKVAEKLAESGLSYWSPGPVTGTAWALNQAAGAVLVSTTSGKLITSDESTAQQWSALVRADELTVTMRNPQHRMVARDGMPFGLALPNGPHDHDRTIVPDLKDRLIAIQAGTCWTVVPFRRVLPARNHVQGHPDHGPSLRGW